MRDKSTGLDGENSSEENDKTALFLASRPLNLSHSVCNTGPGLEGCTAKFATRCIRN